MTFNFLAILVILALLWFLTILQTSNKITDVTLYDNSNYGGRTDPCKDLESYSPFYLAVIMNEKATSVRVQKLTPDKAVTVQMCARTTRTTRCPINTFVKTFATNQDDNLPSQFQGECFTPGDHFSPSAILSSHSSVSGLGRPTQCIGAIRGISYGYDSTRETYYDIYGSCTATGSQACGKNEAVCGFSTQIEWHTKLIKNLRVICCNVGDPAWMCDPGDFFESVLTCNNLEADAYTTCTLLQTVGYGNSASDQGSRGQAEYYFYKKMGYEIGVAGYGLEVNFKQNLGESGVTSYNWITAPSITWEQKTSKEVKMEVPPCVKVELFQVVGWCSFFSVHSTYYKRVDTFCNGTVTDIMVSSDALLPGKTQGPQPLKTEN